MRAAPLLALAVLGCASTPRHVAPPPTPRAPESEPIGWTPKPRHPLPITAPWKVTSQDQAVAIVSRCKGYQRYVTDRTVTPMLLVPVDADEVRPWWLVIVGDDVGDRVATIDTCTVDARTGEADCRNGVICP